MASKRHNLSRRAVLGAGVGACVAAAQPPAAQAAATPSRTRWTRTLAAYAPKPGWRRSRRRRHCCPRSGGNGRR
jgi:hypothetical protein